MANRTAWKRSNSALVMAEEPIVRTENLSAISGRDWNYDRAAHLLERAGFGGTPEEIERLAAMTPEQAVAALVDTGSRFIQRRRSGRDRLVPDQNVQVPSR